MNMSICSRTVRHFSIIALALVYQTGCKEHDISATHTQSPGPASAQYIANAGVMISNERTKIVFDPLFNNTYGQYQPLPEHSKSALLNGRAPFDNIDAIMISHHHGDHFDANDMLTLLRNSERVQIYAPSQAVLAMKEIATEVDTPLFTRIVPLNINHHDEPQALNVGNLLIEVVNIPHAGWPTRHSGVQNLSYRVTLKNSVTVTHMGDADINPAHFLNYEDYWSSRQTDLALPPYWYLQSESGRQILAEHVHAKTAIGVHVPEHISKTPAERPPEYRDLDLFTTPGETREITHQE